MKQRKLSVGSESGRIPTNFDGINSKLPESDVNIKVCSGGICKFVTEEKKFIPEGIELIISTAPRYLGDPRGMSFTVTVDDTTARELATEILRQLDGLDHISHTKPYKG